MAGAGRPLAVVNIARVEVSQGFPRAICTLWCRGEHHRKGEKQPLVTCNKSAVKTAEHAVRNLRLKIETEHAGCIAAAEVAHSVALPPEIGRIRVPEGPRVRRDKSR